MDGLLLAAIAVGIAALVLLALLVLLRLPLPGYRSRRPPTWLLAGLLLMSFGLLIAAIGRQSWLGITANSLLLISFVLMLAASLGDSRNRGL